MKTIKILSFLAAVITISAFADTVTSVSASQQWPWNGKVDIKYTLNSEAANPSFNVRFYWKTGEGSDNSIPNSKISGDGACTEVTGAGQKLAIWDASDDLEETKVNDLQIGVDATDISASVAAQKYAKIDLTTYEVTFHSSIDVSQSACKTSEMWFRRVAPGTFIMGSSPNEPRRYASETEHAVTITKPYWIGVFELTKAQYERIANNDDTATSAFPQTICYDALRGTDKGAGWPTIKTFDGSSFLGVLKTKVDEGNMDSMDEFKIDLPTEAQWEMACRDKGDGTYLGSSVWNDGSANLNSGYSRDANLDNLAWCCGNAVHEVGLKTPNAIGLYDMHGNVQERCLDWWTNDLTGYNLDPVGPTSEEATGSFTGYRVSKGGARSQSFTYYFRIAFRNNPGKPDSATSDVDGCRLVLVR